jgi:hypothetical protein
MIIVRIISLMLNLNCSILTQDMPGLRFEYGTTNSGTVTLRAFIILNLIIVNNQPSLKQHASRFMIIFMKILKMYLKIKYCEVNKESKLHIANGTYIIHVNYQKEVKIDINTSYYISNAVEL